MYFDARNVQRQQQPPLSSANDDPNDDPDYQSYKLFKEQTLRKNEQEDREMEMLLELQRKAEEIERRAQMSREQQQQQQQMQMQMSNQQHKRTVRLRSAAFCMRIFPSSRWVCSFW